ncbi:xanthine dehydrogenase [Roseovarius sp. 22II1-1F6A]|nr:xanthine dehydrogenase [Roseovarius sp. 22II1-1F6A]
MTKQAHQFGTSQSIKRIEDLRLLTGHGRYVDDIAPEGALHAYFLRSPVAHAQITTLDVAEARALDGVHLVLTAADLEAAGLTASLPFSVMTNRDGSKGAAPHRPILARDRVRFVGEAVAIIVADTPEIARDAAELVELDLDDLDVSLGLAPGGPQIHAEAPDNVAFDWGIGDEAATDAALAASAHRISMEVTDNRVIINPLETRGSYAEWDGSRLHYCVNGQGVWDLKTDLAQMLGLDEDAVRVTNPDVGGGFGLKAQTFPEDFAIAQAARVLGRPVRWQADRGEAMLSDHAGRDLVSQAEIGFDENFRITAYKVENLSNLGAYNSGFGQGIQSTLFAKVFAGTYDIRTAYLGCRGIYTNTTQTDAYRGAGRPEAIYVLERVMDTAARQLGISPWDLRRRNFIAPDAFPYRTVVGELYDVGDFARVLDRVEAEADVAGFAARRDASAAQGKLRGIGLCYYIESILGDPSEGAAVELTEDGGATLYVGTQSNGQGHETVYAGFLSARTGIPVEAIEVVQGDSDRIKQGGGTGGSRSVTTQTTATVAMIDAMIRSLTPFVAEQMGTDPDAVRFDDDHRFRAEGSNMSPDLREVAQLARAAGRDDLLRHEARAKLPGRSYPNGGHVAEVEIDPETGLTQVVRYTVTDDFGVLVHPQLVEGQVHGGIAQGIGQAISEHTVYDDTGQLLTASFMDYGMPRAVDMPGISFSTEPVPSTANVLGMKGCGEAGTVGSLAAVSNAVLDALWARGVRRADMPFTPMRVWDMLARANAPES